VDYIDTIREGIVHAIDINEIKNGIYSLLFDLYVEDTVVTKIAEVGFNLSNNAVLYSFSVKYGLIQQNTAVNITISSV